MSKTIEELFNTMEYGFKDEEPTAALNWLNTNKNWINVQLQKFGDPPGTVEVYTHHGQPIVSFNSTEKSSLQQESSDTSWRTLDKLEKVNLVQDLAFAVEENADLFAQLDALQRNVLFRNIKEIDIPYFVEYFQTCGALSAEMTALGDLSVNVPLHITTSMYPSRSPLYTLCLLGAGLFSKANITLSATKEGILVVLLFMDLCNKIGIPLDNAIIIKLKITEEANNSVIFKQQSAALVYGGVDVDSAVEGILEGTISCVGSRPWSIKRILIHEPVYDRFIQKLSKSLYNLKFGTAFDKSADSTKIIDPFAVSTAERIITSAKEDGLEVLQCESGGSEFFPPTFIFGRPNCLQNQVCQTPVATIEVFRSIEEGLRLLANTQIHVTSVSIWSDSFWNSQKIVSLLQAPTVWINMHGIYSPKACILNDVIFLNNILCIHDVESNSYSCSINKTKILKKFPEIINAQCQWEKLKVEKRSALLTTGIIKLKFSGIMEPDCLLKVLCSLPGNLDVQLTPSNHSVFVSHKPRGIVVFHTDESVDEFHILKVLLKLLLWGNCVIMTADFSDDCRIANFLKILKENSQTNNIVAILPSDCVTDITDEMHTCCTYKIQYEKYLSLSETKTVWFSKP